MMQRSKSGAIKLFKPLFVFANFVFTMNALHAATTNLPSFESMEKQSTEPPSREITKWELIESSNQRHIKHNLFLLEAFDPRCLSNDKCTVSLEVIYTDKGVPIIKILGSENATKADEFYCEQAVWEIVDPAYKLKRGIYRFYGRPNHEFGEHAELIPKEPEFVLMHLIPQFFPSINLLPLGVINTPENVLKLEKTKLSEPRLSAFRREWFSFWQPPTSSEVLFNKAAAIKKKYADFFEQ